MYFLNPKIGFQNNSHKRKLEIFRGLATLFNLFALLGSIK